MENEKTTEPETETETETESETESETEATASVIAEPEVIGMECPIHGRQNTFGFSQDAVPSAGIKGWGMKWCMRCAAEALNEAVALKLWRHKLDNEVPKEGDE